MGPTPAVADVRHAVRASLESVAQRSPGALVLAACSGGGDSLALAAALAFEAPRAGLLAGGVTVDHRLQAGSGPRAQAVVSVLRSLGLDPVCAVEVNVTGPGGPEAAARAARYAALEETARRCGAVAVLLGHTLDDQAETVLLGMARGSGTRSLAGMAAITGPDGLYRRPLLAISRATTKAACVDAGMAVWDDPHNGDPAFTRARVRSSLLPTLDAELGPGIAAALARTADLARDDADALDCWAGRAFAELNRPELTRPGGDPGEDKATIELDVAELAALPAAIRRRVFRLAAIEVGTPAGSLAAVHLYAVDALLTDWHGQGSVSLPAGRLAWRRYGRLFLSIPAEDRHIEPREGHNAWTSPTSEPTSSQSY